jgi:methionyl-tRNA formyltransferase
MTNPAELRIVFMGSPEFAVPSLERLHEAGFTITAVVTGPDKRRGRGVSLSATPVKVAALKLEIPVIETDNLRDETFREQLQQLGADLFVVVAFRILPKALLTIPRIGAVNLHGSLLPRYRGAAPIHRAVMNGETHTGATIFMLDENVDTGSYLAQLHLPIAPNDTTGDIYQRMMHEGANLLVHAVHSIQKGNYTLTPQDSELATSAPKIFADDCQLNFSRSSSQVHNHIRGLSPFPVAFSWLNGKRLRIYASENRPDVSLNAGEFQISNHEVLVGCNPGAVKLLDIQLEGKNRMAAIDFFRGYTGEGRLSTK